MRKQLFLAIAQHIKAQVPELKYIGVWNEHMATITANTSWPVPSLFIEFEQFTVRQLANKCCEADVPVRLHIVTRAINAPAGVSDSNFTAALDYFDLLDKVHVAMVRLSGDGFSTFQLTDCATNHNHTELLESIDRYVTRAVDSSAVRQHSVKSLSDIDIINRV